MACIFGLAHVKEIEAMQHEGYEVLPLDARTVKLLCGTRPDYSGQSMRYIMVFLPLPVSEIVFATDPDSMDNADPPTLKLVQYE